MSADEMRAYCQSICPYQLRVQVRLKNGREIFVGKIGNVEGESFELVSDDNEIRQFKYAWVAGIRNN